MKIYLTALIILLSFSTSFSQETKCECYSKSGVKEKTGIGGWTSVIGKNDEGEQLQYHFYVAYFPPQELCIPRGNVWWREVETAMMKAIKSHPIYKSSQIAIQIEEGNFTANAEQLTGAAFITQKEVSRIEKMPGTIVSVDAYIQEHFASKLDLCSDIENKNSSTETIVKDDKDDYKVLDVDTSVYEADKTRKRRFAEENRQKEAEQERRDREYKERKNAFEKEQLAKLNRSTQAYEQRQTNLTNAGNTLLNAMDNMSRQADAKRANQQNRYEEEERQREAERLAEKQLRTIAFNKRQAENANRIRKLAEVKAKQNNDRILEDNQREFANSLKDQPIPIIVERNKVYFFMVDTFGNPTHIRFAPFIVLADSNKNIPYRKDITSDFQLKTFKAGYKIYGPYNTQLEQESAINMMTSDAAKINISRESDLTYTYDQDKTHKINSETDFWGDKTKTRPKETKKKKDDSFWDN
jgi:hypothetical protein